MCAIWGVLSCHLEMSNNASVCCRTYGVVVDAPSYSSDRKEVKALQPPGAASEREINTMDELPAWRWHRKWLLLDVSRMLCIVASLLVQQQLLRRTQRPGLGPFGDTGRSTCMVSQRHYLLCIVGSTQPWSLVPE